MVKLHQKENLNLHQRKNYLRAIFGDKAGDVKDASLKATPSKEGVVVAKQLFVRRKKDRANKAEDKTKLTKLEKDHLRVG